jgi:hypothetical protein
MLKKCLALLVGSVSMIFAVAAVEGQCPNSNPNEFRFTLKPPPLEPKTATKAGVGISGQVATIRICHGCTVDDMSTTIDWGDGSKEQVGVGASSVTWQPAAVVYAKPTQPHIYGKVGHYTITLTATHPHCVNNGHGYPEDVFSNTFDVDVNDPRPVNTVAVTPAVVTHPGSATGTVSLTDAAPKGGSSVFINAVQNPAGIAVMPAAVVVPEGQLETTFTITTSGAGRVRLTATTNAGNVSAPVTLTIN